MYSQEFWADVCERVIRTAAQTALGSIGATALVTDVNWAVVGGTVALSAVATILMALAAPAKEETGTASFRNAPVD